MHVLEVGIIVAVFAVFSAIGWLAGHWRGGLPTTLDEWGLGGRRNGTIMTWLLLGGVIFTAYTYVAVPALVAGVGGLGLFALPYTILVWPVFYLVAPRLWSVARANRYVTAADFAQGRHGSTALGVAVALTGLLATMPYLTLQLVGISVVLSAAGLPGDAPLLIAFFVLAAATWRSGLRAPTLGAVVKDGLVAMGLVALLMVVPGRVGGLAHAFDVAANRVAVVPATSDSIAYVTLAAGSTLALFLYPHSVTGVLAARNRAALRRSAAMMPAFTLLLGVIALFGILAVAAGVRPSLDGAPRTLPQLVQQTTPEPLAGIVFASIAVGALVPAAVMSIGAANLFARNVYRDWIRPDASDDQQLRVARIVSLLIKFGALVFVVGLRTQDAINLQLLGGVWILQTLPAVGVGLFARCFHRRALLAGWAVGMVLGTLLAASQGFVGIFPLALGSVHVGAYPGLLALIANLLVAGLATPLLRWFGVPEGRDRTRPQDYHARGISTPDTVRATA